MVDSSSAMMMGTSWDFAQEFTLVTRSARSMSYAEALCLGPFHSPQAPKGRKEEKGDGGDPAKELAAPAPPSMTPLEKCYSDTSCL